MTAATPAPPPLDDGLDQLLRRMRLPHMRRLAPEVLAVAKAQRWDPAEVLRALLAEEVAGRDRSSLATRRARAAFPTGKTFDAWDQRLSSVPGPTQSALRTLEWVGRHENLVVCGPSGTGKTFLLEALGQAAVEAGKHVAWFTLEQLGTLVRAHRADDSVTRAIARILRADLVVVDRHRAPARRARRRRGALPPGRRRLRAPLGRGQLEPAPLGVRRADAQDTGHRHSGPADASRARLPDRRRQHPPVPGPRRKGSDAPQHLTPKPVWWPPPGRSGGHQRADLMTVPGQFLMSLDSY